MVTIDNFTRVNNDVNGNPRYVIHFLDVISNAEYEQEKHDKIKCDIKGIGYNGILKNYEYAVNKMKQLGGKRYRGKNYGGGIVFQSYNIQETANRINELLK